MKELEKTKRISISAILIIGLLFIGFLGFKMPTNVFKKTKAELLSKVVSMDYFISKEKVFSDSYVNNSKLIDIRNEFDYNKGHFDSAINIPTGHLLLKDNIDLIHDFSDKGNTIVLYGSTPEEANAAWMLLYQLDIPKLKILSETVSVQNNKFISEPYIIEKPIVDFAQKMKSLQVAKGLNTNKTVKKKKTKLRKKKKKKAEGGC